MVSWDLRRLQQYLSRHEPGPLYLVTGEETFMVQEALHLFKSKIFDDGSQPDFNFDQFYASETNGVTVRDAVETLPMMAPRRLVLLKDAHHWKDKEWEDLYPVLEAPVTSSVLVIVSEKIDKRKKFVKLLADHGVICEFPRPYDNQVPSWIDYIAYKRKLELTPQQLQLIHQLVGGSLIEIDNELRKLCQFLGDRKKVTDDEILQVISMQRSEKIFDLTHAIAKKDLVQALQILANLLDHQENLFGLLSLIHRHFKTLLLLNEGQRLGLTGPKLCTRSGIPPFFLKGYLDQGRNWTDGQLLMALSALRETDKALKSSPLSPHIWLENFILKVCSSDQKAEISLQL